MYYNSQRSDAYCAMVDLSKTHDRINTTLLRDKTRETDLTGQVMALINFMDKNTSVCTSYGGQLRNEWNDKNGVRERG